MEHLQQFLAYANAFEKTLADDDWSRIEPYFAADAVYEVKGSYGCRLEGPEAIFRGIKKSLDGFDRKFTSRDVALMDAPTVEGDEIGLHWQVTYHKEGLTPYVLKGRSQIRYRGDQIVHLTDSFDDGVESNLREWESRNGVNLDPAYV